MKIICNEFRTARIKVLAYGVAIMMSIVPAALYYLNEMQHIQIESRQYSQLICERLEQAIAENPQLWQFATPKFTEITKDRQWFPYIESVAVYDSQSRLIHREEPTQALVVRFFSPQQFLYYKGNIVGFVQLENRLDSVLLWTLLILLLGFAGGGVLGYEIYRSSSRSKRYVERQSCQAFANMIQINERMERMTNRDYITGTDTITYVSRILKHMLANAVGKVSVLLVDIDFFRNYNEQQGHESGDAVLRTMANLLRQQLRKQDMIGRFGGEEFIIVLPDTEILTAVKVANQLRIAVEEHDFDGASVQPKGRLTVSIGISSTETASLVQELFQQVDVAVYKAKCAGRNCVCAFELPETETKLGNFAEQSPKMKEEVTTKFIKRFFRGTSQDFLELYDPTILAFLKALEIWDAETVRHSLRVNRIAMMIGKEIDLPIADRLTLNLGTLLHDIGKLTIGDTILIKPGALTHEEYELMKNHPRIGSELVRDNPGLHKASDIIFMHHEWFDGTGYPQGLAGKKIPLLARICAVADAMDAMMTDRPYRKGKKEEEVRSEIAKNGGRQFDPEIAEVVLSLDWRQFYHHGDIPVLNGMTGLESSCRA